MGGEFIVGWREYILRNVLVYVLSLMLVWVVDFTSCNQILSCDPVPCSVAVVFASLAWVGLVGLMLFGVFGSERDCEICAERGCREGLRIFLLVRYELPFPCTG